MDVRSTRVKRSRCLTGSRPSDLLTATDCRREPCSDLPHAHQGSVLLPEFGVVFRRCPGAATTFCCNRVRNLDARALMHYQASGITPAMSMKMVGGGSQYAVAVTDFQGKPLDGSKTYKIRLPPNIPAKQFWSFTVHHIQTRSMLQSMSNSPASTALIRCRGQPGRLGRCLVRPGSAQSC
jgi:hypothetical protein